MRASNRDSKRRRLKIRALRFWTAFILVASACLVLVCGYVVLAKASRPFIISHAESKEIEEINKKIADEKAHKKDLLTERNYLLTPRGQETEARRQGFVRKGEKAVIIESSNTEIEDESTPQSTPVQKSFWQKTKLSILKLLK